jgi:hypothetical protein
MNCRMRWEKKGVGGVTGRDREDLEGSGQVSGDWWRNFSHELAWLIEIDPNSQEWRWHIFALVYSDFLSDISDFQQIVVPEVILAPVEITVEFQPCCESGSIYAVSPGLASFIFSTLHSPLRVQQVLSKDQERWWYKIVKGLHCAIAFFYF